MSGPLDFAVQMNAEARSIQRLKGRFQTTAPGRMHIGKIDELLARIPSGWSPLKQDTVRIALETLRDFDYDTAGGEFWFVDRQGILDLALQGPFGSRKFHIVLHADESTTGQWKKTSNP
jgi:hypothetical protein